MASSNWLYFSEELCPEWNRHAGERISRVIGRDVSVSLTLPTQEEAREAFDKNYSLFGKFDVTDSGKSFSSFLPLPFNGVFVLQNDRGRTAHTLVWNSWLGEREGVRLVSPASARGRGNGEREIRLAAPDGSFLRLPLDSENGPRKDAKGKKDFKKRCKDMLVELPLELWDEKSYPKWLWEAMEKKAVTEDLLRGHIGDLGAPVDQDDLAHRVVVSFPRWLEFRLCRIILEKDKFDEASLGPFGRLAVPVMSLAKMAFSYVDPINAVDLLSRINGVRRFAFKRKVAATMPAEYRQNHPSFDGRLCPIETPESELVGLSLQLARGASVAADGEIMPADVAERLGWGVSLIPFAHHNDGARDMMGAKNLRQATPVAGREAPSVRTGAESALLERMKGLLETELCPDCRDKNGNFALGRDLLTAYLPWKGFNIDDAVVISRRAAKKMGIVEHKSFRRPLAAGWRIVGGLLHDAAFPKELSRGDVIAELENADGKRKVVYDDALPAKLLSGAAFTPAKGTTVLSYELEKILPLSPGDKLMGRHGNKGVVARVLDDSEMPRLPKDETLPVRLRGCPVEILLNPHGVLSRMNPGQLLETHLGWLAHAGRDLSAVAKDGCGADAIGRPVMDGVDLGKMKEELVASGLDCNGCIRLDLPDGKKTVNSVFVGFQHIVRLHHVPALKAQARRGGEGAAYSSVTEQAAHGRAVGGGQRLGEMEVWALAAYGADSILSEMLGPKSNRRLARAWTDSECPPRGGGISDVVKDWLFALAIDMEQGTAPSGAATVTFRCLTDEEIRREPGVVCAVTERDEYKPRLLSAFRCRSKRGCSFTLEGKFPYKESGETRILEVGEFFGWYGYKDCSSPLVPLEDGSYDWTVVKGGKCEPLRLLVKKIKGFKPDGTSLTLQLFPSGNMPEWWPKDQGEFFELVCRGQFDSPKGEEKNAKGGKFKNEYVLQCLTSGTRSLGDFLVCCPSHRSLPLQAFGEVTPWRSSKAGGIFDEMIFGRPGDWRDGIGGWGYIELPRPVPYPFGPDDEKDVPGISVISVLPVRYRMPVGNDIGKLNSLYNEVIRCAKPAEDEKSDGGDNEEDGQGDSAKSCKKKTDPLFSAVKALFKEIRDKLDGKDGLIRHDGLGRRVDRSFRLVITPNPELKWDEAGIPADVLWEVLGDRIEAKGVAANVPVRIGWDWRNRRNAPEDCYGKLSDYLKEHSDTYILLNRQPSLHRDNFQAFRPVPLPREAGEVIQLSPLCCKGFAADFDGDEMVGHVPVSSAANREAARMLPSANLISAGSGKFTANLDRDFVTGLELIYRNQEKYRKVIDGLDSCCRELFDRGMGPGDFGKRIVEHLSKEHGAQGADVISALARTAYEACTVEGVSFGFCDLVALADRFRGREWDDQEMPKTMAAEVSADGTASSGERSVALLVGTEANGKKQIKQIVDTRKSLKPGKLGFAGEIVVGDCNLVGGMEWKDMFAASYNARSSMCDKKLGTAQAGDLTRKLVFALWPWRIVEFDCGCSEDERSILHCKAEDGFCKACYEKSSGRTVKIGDPVGLIAAQSIGERGTQVSMQSFHFGRTGIDIAKSRQIFLRCEKPKEASENHNFADSKDREEKRCLFESFEEFANALASEYGKEKLATCHLEVLWRALERMKEAGGASLAGSSGGDESLTRMFYSRQFAELLKMAEKNMTLSSEKSPFADIFFNSYRTAFSEK